MSKRTIKQFVPVPADYSVLISWREGDQKTWRDYSREGMNYFWALVDGEEDDDYIQLMAANVDGCNTFEIDDAVVAPRNRCPECGADVVPVVTPERKSFLRYVCPNCGYGLPVRPLY